MISSYPDLKTELDTDPVHLGYATQEESRIVELLNAKTQAIPVSLVSKDQVIWSLASELASLQADMALGVSKALKYGPLLQQFSLLTQVDLTNAWLQGQFASLITDGYATIESIGSLTNRAGSRAEALFGAGAFVTLDDIEIARRQ